MNAGRHMTRFARLILWDLVKILAHGATVLGLGYMGLRPNEVLAGTWLDTRNRDVRDIDAETAQGIRDLERYLAAKDHRGP
jgi:hypothetical protein